MKTVVFDVGKSLRGHTYIYTGYPPQLKFGVVPFSYVEFRHAAWNRRDDARVAGIQGVWVSEQ